jgi:hypothetical protein
MIRIGFSVIAIGDDFFTTLWSAHGGLKFGETGLILLQKPVSGLWAGSDNRSEQGTTSYARANEECPLPHHSHFFHGNDSQYFRN